MPFRDPITKRAYNIAYQKAYYRSHKVEFREKNRLRKRAARLYLQSLKRAVPREVCGETDFRCLDFHHSDDQEKVAGLSELATNGTSIDALVRELEKCNVLCKNCRAKEHFKQ